jgi:ribonuclease HI
MNVTINTDASFSLAHKRGSFAFWIVCDNFKILKSGMLRAKVNRPEQAELKAIINAFHVLFNEDCSQVTKVIVNTDCLNAIHLITGNKEAIRKYQLASWGRDLVMKYEAVKRKTKHTASLPVEFRHVRSHTGVGDARSYVNEWCDREAKLKLKAILNTKTA